ncbi:hypothetical protein ACIQNU_05870 [Streptomyces sp. NPDC091292]|uniref:DUF7144 family membrane protein n=1 Tax=Streptomyces sp. NPDC091292 TaxID=3365991 RepID=UPI0038277E41
MSTSTPPSAGAPAPGRTPHDRRPTGREGWATGGTVFAGVLLLVTGVLAILNGIAAVATDDIYTSIGNYVFKFSLTSWGWIHIVLGVVVALAGYGVLKGADWGRALGVGLASLTIVLNFIWLPYQPLWALTMIALSIFVIWALCSSWGRKSAF